MWTCANAEFCCGKNLGAEQSVVLWCVCVCVYFLMQVGVRVCVPFCC